MTMTTTVGDTRLSVVEAPEKMHDENGVPRATVTRTLHVIREPTVGPFVIRTRAEARALAIVLEAFSEELP